MLARVQSTAVLSRYRPAEIFAGPIASLRLLSPGLKVALPWLGCPAQRIDPLYPTENLVAPCLADMVSGRRDSRSGDHQGPRIFHAAIKRRARAPETTDAREGITGSVPDRDDFPSPEAGDPIGSVGIRITQAVLLTWIGNANFNSS